MDMENRNRDVILVVDDNPANLGVLFDLLKASDYKVLMAVDGREGINCATEVRPDIILLDILMPGIDGFETCARLKEQPETKDIPIIFMTALSEVFDKIRGFELGAADYITKPFHHEEILARIKTQLTIRRQKKELETLIASRDKFFSIIAHDLKSPISGIISGTGMLLSMFDKLEREQIRELLFGMNEISHNVFNLLNNLLYWSLSQTGSVTPDPDILDVRRIVDETIELIKMNAAEKKISVINRVDENHRVFADKKMVETVLRNLLSNAIKYTGENGNVKAESVKTGDFIEIRVSDSGVGISAKNIEKLFRLDAKFRRRGTSNESGTGLGLILCKDFVEVNGGEIHVESLPDCGSMFGFTLPATGKV